MAMKKNINWRAFIRRLPAYLLVYGWTVFSVVGILYIILGSFKTRYELIKHPWELPESWNFVNYVTAWTSSHLGLYFLNSLIVVSISVILILVVSTPAAYVISRARFKFRESLTTYIIMGMGIPIPLLYIPLFVIMSWLRLNDTLTGLTVAFIVASIPFTIYLLTGFFSTIPSALEDAAVIDGCTEWQLFRRVMLPLAKPGMITATIFNFIWLWNEYQLSLVLINTSEKRTLPLGLYALQNAMQYTGDWPGLMAGVTIIMIPTVIIYIFLSEKLIAGVTAGSVK